MPVWWEERENKRLRLLLRCGECDTHHDLVVVGEVADRFEKEYVRVLEAMAATLDRLDRERMATEASAFATALARDLIDADDFGSGPDRARARQRPDHPDVRPISEQRPDRVVRDEEEVARSRSARR